MNLFTSRGDGNKHPAIAAIPLSVGYKPIYLARGLKPYTIVDPANVVGVGYKPIYLERGLF